MTADPTTSDLQRAVVMLGGLGNELARGLHSVTGSREIAGHLPVAVMFVLEVDGPQRPGRLQEVTGLTSGGVSRLLERMEAEGLIERRSGAVEGDRRGVRVTLTPQGEEVARSMAQAFREQLPRLRDVVRDLGDLIGARSA